MRIKDLVRQARLEIQPLDPGIFPGQQGRERELKGERDAVSGQAACTGALPGPQPPPWEAWEGGKVSEGEVNARKLTGLAGRSWHHGCLAIIRRQ